VAAMLQLATTAASLLFARAFHAFQLQTEGQTSQPCYMLHLLLQKIVVGMLVFWTVSLKLLFIIIRFVY